MNPRAILALSCALAALSACATASTFPMAGNPQLPAAEGTVQARVGENGNTELTVNVKHLAPPGRIAAGATSFVVWVKPIQEFAPAQNLGALQVDADLTGRLRTVTALKQFSVTVTPEASSTAIAPTGAVVLQAEISQK